MTRATQRQRARRGSVRVEVENPDSTKKIEDWECAVGEREEKNGLDGAYGA